MTERKDWNISSTVSTGASTVSTSSFPTDTPTPTKTKGRRSPVSYVLVGIATLLATALIFVGFARLQDEANARERTLARVEIAYAVARNQINAAGLTPAPGAPSLPILVGPEGITGNQGAPPIVQFDLPIPQEPTKEVHIVCKDSSGSGDYQNCTESVVPASAETSPTSTTK